MEKNEILVLHGTGPREMAFELCRAANLADLIGGREKTVGLKPNLVKAAPAAEGATTHPEVAEGVLQYLKEKGFARVDIIEGAWVGARTPQAFRACGYTALAEKYGARLVDTQADTHTRRDCAGLAIDICDSALAVDFMINLPVMKGHCQTVLTCALKNNKGVIPNSEKRRFHTLGLHRPIAHLNTVAKNDFVLVDAICGDLDFEEGGNPVQTDMLFAARDPVLADAFAARQMGLDPAEVRYLALAEGLGVGSADVDAATITPLNEGRSGGRAPAPTGKARRLAAYMEEDAACSACAAALVRALSQLDRRALERLPGRVCLGQGWQGRAGQIGVGRCTAGFARSVPGCPPAAADIRAMLEG